MNNYIECKTQSEVDAAVAAGDIPQWSSGKFTLSGSASADLSGNAHALLSGSARAVLYGNAHANLTGNAHANLTGNARAFLHGSARAILKDSASAVLYGSARADLHDSARADLFDSASADLHGSARAILKDNARATLQDNARAFLHGNASAELYDNAHANLYGNASANLYGNAHANLTGNAIAYIYSLRATATGGTVRKCYGLKTAAEWCEAHGLPVEHGVVVLFKGVTEDFTSPYGMSYAPGSIPVAPDWDGGSAECGGGLHFSPTPWHTHRFIYSPKHYIACPVRVEEIVVHENAKHPDKVKAPCCCAPVWEVDINGKEI